MLLSFFLFSEDVDIFFAANNSLCKEILKSFLTSFQKDSLLKNVQKKNDKEMVLSKSAIFVFFDSPAINEDINTTLDIVNPNGNDLPTCKIGGFWLWFSL